MTEIGERIMNGLGIFEALGFFFVALKLTGQIDWSWWLVLLPFYGQWVLVFVLAVIFYIVGKFQEAPTK